jgi:hypothetical protein
MKRLLVTSRTLYDASGKYLGKEVVETDQAFTEEELRPSQCSECGAANGSHREYFVKTGQSGGGEVYGHYQNCSKANSR